MGCVDSTPGVSMSNKKSSVDDNVRVGWQYPATFSQPASWAQPANFSKPAKWSVTRKK